MAYMEWKDQYNLNLEHIDQQHQKLVAQINLLDENILKGSEQDKIGEILNALVSYTQQHFRDEETYMAEINYPELEEHKIEHKALIKEVADFLVKRAEDNNFDSFELLLFLKEWLIDHILQSDKKIKAPQPV